MSKYAPHKRSANQAKASSSTICQRCLQRGHFIYECKNERPYVSRPSRTQQLENPRLLAKLKADGKPSVEVPEEFKNKTGVANKILEAKEKERSKEIKQKEFMCLRSNVGSTFDTTSRSSSSDSNSSGSDSDSEADSTSTSSSDSDSEVSSDSDSTSRSRLSSRSRSRDPKRRRRRSRSPSSSDRRRE